MTLCHNLGLSIHIQSHINKTLLLHWHAFWMLSMKSCSSKRPNLEKNSATVWHSLTQLRAPWRQAPSGELAGWAWFPIQLNQESRTQAVMVGPWRTYTTSTLNRETLKGRTGEGSGDTLEHLPALRGDLQEIWRGTFYNDMQCKHKW